MNRITLNFCKLLTVATVPCVSLAAGPPATRPAHSRQQTTTAVYDIHDLVHAPRDYSAPNAMIPPTDIGHEGAGLFGGNPHPSSLTGGGGATAFVVPPAQAASEKSPEDRLIILLEETVDPESWRDNGGSDGALKEMNGMLIVTQTAENQKALAAVFAQLREPSTRLVTVRAHWVAIDSNQLDKMTTPTKQPGAGDAAVLLIDPASLNKLDAKALHYRAQTTCFNGQTVRVASGQARTVITQVTPVIGQAALGYSPDASLVQAGATLELTPRLTSDQTAAVIDVTSVVSDWGTIQTAPPAPTTQPGSINPPDNVDRLHLLAQHLRTSVLVPVGKAIVVGGMTLDPTTTGGDARQVYLILEVVGAAK